jgi:biotin operon repressor
MRARRLISLLLLLQSRGHGTAAELADELGVSVRTVYRDLEALGSAGIPVTTERGPGGGCRLIGGYRTQLTGLDAGEAEALFLSGLPGPAAEPAWAAARARAAQVLAALPARLREPRAGRPALHLDPRNWFQPQPEHPALGRSRRRSGAMARALRLRRADGQASSAGRRARARAEVRLLVPGRARRRDLRVYRVSRVSAWPSDASFRAIPTSRSARSGRLGGLRGRARGDPRHGASRPQRRSGRALGDRRRAAGEPRRHSRVTAGCAGAGVREARVRPRAPARLRRRRRGARAGGAARRASGAARAPRSYTLAREPNRGDAWPDHEDDEPSAKPAAAARPAASHPSARRARRDQAGLKNLQVDRRIQRGCARPSADRADARKRIAALRKEGARSSAALQARAARSRRAAQGAPLLETSWDEIRQSADAVLGDARAAATSFASRIRDAITR